MTWKQRLRIVWIEEVDFWRDSLVGFFKLFPDLGWFGKVCWILLAINPAFCVTIVWVAFAFRSLFHALDLWHWLRRQPIDFDSLEVDVLPSAWRREVTAAQAEAENSSFPDRRSIDGLPFGFQHESWLEVSALIQVTDQLYFFYNEQIPRPEEGYVVVREGQPIAKLVTCEFFEDSHDFESDETDDGFIFANASG